MGVFVLPPGAPPPAGCMLRLWFDPAAGRPSMMDAEGSHEDTADSAGCKEASGELMQITVPPGVVAGQALAVTVPDGRQLTFILPPRALPGMGLELWYDQRAGTLVALD